MKIFCYITKKNSSPDKGLEKKSPLFKSKKKKPS